MADTKMTYAAASDLQEAVRVLEAQEAAGTITRTEQAALDKFRQKQPDARMEMAKTRATYRGFGQGATLGGGDELTSALSALGGGDYTAALEKSRMLNQAAQLGFPEEYSTGRMAGTGAIATLPIGGAQALAARSGMGLAGRTAVGAAEGGLLASMQGFLEGEGGFGSRVKNISPIAAGTGMVLGGAGPLAGEATSMITRRMQDVGRKIDGFGPKASRVMAGRLGAAQRGGTDIEQYLRDLGDQGMLADVVGTPMSTAQGLASMGGEGADILSRKIYERAAGAGPRIERTVEDVAGAPNRAFQERVARANERTNVFGPEYEAAIAQIAPIDANPIIAGIDQRSANAVGDVRSALNSLKANLSENNGVISAERLHNIRVDLSATMNAATRAGKGGVAKSLEPYLAAIDAHLDTVGGYQAARSGYANNRAMERAAKAGREDVFSGTARTAKLPDEFAAQFAKMSDAEKDAMRAGAREYVAALMGTARNDPAAAWGEFSKGFSAEKLKILFGNAEANKILNTLRGEQAFSNTRTKVLEGAQSAQRREAAQGLQDVTDPNTGKQTPLISRVKGAFIDDPANAVINSILYGNSRSQANADIGRLLSLQGAERDAAVRSLLAEAQRQQTDTKAQAVAKNLVELMLRSGGAAYATSAQ